MAVYACVVSAGQLISYIICLAFDDDWRWMLGIAGFPALIQLSAMLFYYTDTPTFYYQKDQDEKAEAIIDKIYYDQDDR